MGSKKISEGRFCRNRPQSKSRSEGLKPIMSAVEKDIDAVKLILACFFDEPENNVERNKLIRRKVAENENVKTYARFSEAELKEQLRFLQVQVSGE